MKKLLISLADKIYKRFGNIHFVKLKSVLYVDNFSTPFVVKGITVDMTLNGKDTVVINGSGMISDLKNIDYNQ
jgi:hypothetical protein